MTLPRPSPRSRKLAAAAAVVLGLAVVVPAQAVAVPHAFFGMQAWTTPSDKELATMYDNGVGTFRFNLEWSVVEPHRGQREWGHADSVVAAAARARLAPLPVLASSPRFAATRAPYPPRSASARRAFAAFLTAAVQRYGRGGSFWAENPGLPYRPVTAWQIWNEPNFPPYWWGHPNVREYVSFLRLSRKAVKAVDPRATIVLGGLPEAVYHGHTTRFPFIDGLYRLGASRLFDVMALHPYSRDARHLLRVVQRVRRVMNQHGDRSKQIWLTEVGWATAGITGDFIVTNRRGQAAKLSDTYRGLLRVRRRYRIGNVTWFSWRDRAPEPDEGNWWAINTGLFDRRGRPKPSWNAFRHFAGR